MDFDQKKLLRGKWDPDISPLFISPPLFFATHNLPLSTFCHFSFRHSHFATHSLPPTFCHPRFCHSSFCHTHFATTVFASLVFANHILPLLLCWKCNCNVHSNCLSIISIHWFEVVSSVTNNPEFHLAIILKIGNILLKIHTNFVFQHFCKYNFCGN